MESRPQNLLINYQGVSGGMEAAEALTCWRRSLQHNMRYIHFVGDGDSSAYKAEKESGVYGETNNKMGVCQPCGKTPEYRTKEFM